LTINKQEKTVINKSAYIRFIFNADDKMTAQNIFNDISSNLTILQNSATELKLYEDDNHFEVSLAVNISAKDITELELKAFKLCTEIANGPWLFVKVPDKENEFEFEAIFNHEAFIHHSKEFNNQLKWAHIEITQ
jgi:hypothetical protein